MAASAIAFLGSIYILGKIAGLTGALKLVSTTLGLSGITGTISTVLMPVLATAFTAIKGYIMTLGGLLWTYLMPIIVGLGIALGVLLLFDYLGITQAISDFGKGWRIVIKKQLTPFLPIMISSRMD